jgi:hypothetical protein
MSTVIKSHRTSTTTVAIAGVGPYPVGFRLYDDDGIKVYVNGAERIDWTLSSAYADGVSDNSSITFGSALAVNDELVIDASLVPWREEDLVQGDGNLVQKLNAELGRIWSSLSEIRRDALRSLRGFDILDPVEGVDLETVAGAETFATAASASASAAATSAALAASAQQNLYDADRGPWATLTAYEQGDLTQEGGSTYICRVDHTSGTFSTDLGAGRWKVFAAKGAPGAGTGDVLAANAGSEYTGVAGSFRANISVMGALLTPEMGADVHARAAANPRGMWFVAGTGMSNAPAGYAANDIFFAKGVDANNVTVVWYRQDGAVFVKSRVAGAWGGWVDQATTAYVDARSITPTTGAPLYYGARAFGRATGGAGTWSFLNQQNFAGITRASLGIYNLTFATAMPDANYAVIATHRQGSGAAIGVRVAGEATTGFTIIAKNSTGGLADAEQISVAVFR